jgi:hypothetical protein
MLALTNKIQFSLLSKQDQSKILDFLNDDYTEDFVLVKLEQNEDEIGLSGLWDATSEEVGEFKFSIPLSFIERDDLLLTLK